MRLLRLRVAWQGSETYHRYQHQWRHAELESLFHNIYASSKIVRRKCNYICCGLSESSSACTGGGNSFNGSKLVSTS